MGRNLPIPILAGIGRITTVPDDARDPNPKPEGG